MSPGYADDSIFIQPSPFWLKGGLPVDGKVPRTVHAAGELGTVDGELLCAG
ncbi:hypothetical protein ALP14_200052 [Pseudomonas amygdali pv. myricae]|uniref:TetR family transcriptional regulator n=1 Tax=Pseudomonas amygdali pv. ulmi TaxID=251720 RepID=A0A0Q0JE20_PSEA0|nr:hypothetical protein ALO41_200206 [Pseudomonas amygdali pv. ulmi]RMT53456.1 hypothetical protein ALP46_200339 [Pseudomonas amygdali pv. myricae]RMV07691.1 hypothetical protein ALP18_200008 [Pseudomonas amygdali pv. myricae]RMV24984.1 hypothetical protein ALP14_200052 [Pseudomonas amygdali pv. myricae]